MDTPGWIVALALALVFVVLPVGFAVYAAVVPLVRARRMRVAQRAPLPAERCVACGRTDLEPIGPGVARCRACGFTGGDGMAALQRERRRVALAKLDPRRRHALALDKLREAQLLLTTAQESLDRAAAASVVDIAGLSPDHGEAKQTDFAHAIRLMDAAFSLATEAAEAVRMSVDITPPAALEQSSMLLALDTAWLTDGPTVDLAIHLRIRKAKDQLREMHARVDALLLQLRAAPDLTST